MRNSGAAFASSGAVFFKISERLVGSVEFSGRHFKFAERLGTLLVPSMEENISSLGAAVQHDFRRALLLTSREENINNLRQGPWCAAVQHNFRRTLLVSSRENISSLGAAIQHDFRRTLLVPSREENIKRISIAMGAAVQPGP